MKKIEITVKERNGVADMEVICNGIQHFEVLGMLHGAINTLQMHTYKPEPPPPEPTKDLLNTEEAIKLLRCSKRTIQNWRNEKRIPFKTIGGKLYYAKDDLLKLIK
jgi:excisionase family DNA binding protein